MKPCNDGAGHHWVIESPDGRRMLPAKCSVCKAVRLYPATNPGLDDPKWLAKTRLGMKQSVPFYWMDRD